jgi:hypothetical protein
MPNLVSSGSTRSRVAYKSSILADLAVIAWLPLAHR